MTGLRISFHHAECVRYRLAEQPFQPKDVGLGTAGKDYAGHRTSPRFLLHGEIGNDV